MKTDALTLFRTRMSPKSRVACLVAAAVRLMRGSGTSQSTTGGTAAVRCAIRRDRLPLGDPDPTCLAVTPRTFPDVRLDVVTRRRPPSLRSSSALAWAVETPDFKGR